MDYDKNLVLYEKAVASLPDIKRKGRKIPYTSVNGHMFSFIDQTGTVGLRLSKDDLKAFQDKYKTGPMEQYGRIMKEYAVVPQSLLEDTATLSALFKKSLQYVGSLKPKKTRRNS